MTGGRFTAARCTHAVPTRKSTMTRSACARRGPGSRRPQVDESSLSASLVCQLAGEGSSGDHPRGRTCQPSSDAASTTSRTAPSTRPRNFSSSFKPFSAGDVMPLTARCEPGRGAGLPSAPSVPGSASSSAHCSASASAACVVQVDRQDMRCRRRCGYGRHRHPGRLGRGLDLPGLASAEPHRHHRAHVRAKHRRFLVLPQRGVVVVLVGLLGQCGQLGVGQPGDRVTSCHRFSQACRAWASSNPILLEHRLPVPSPGGHGAPKRTPQRHYTEGEEEDVRRQPRPALGWIDVVGVTGVQCWSTIARTVDVVRAGEHPRCRTTPPSVGLKSPRQVQLRPSPKYLLLVVRHSSYTAVKVPGVLGPNRADQLVPRLLTSTGTRTIARTGTAITST